MINGRVLIIGSGHLAYRLKRLIKSNGYEIIQLPNSAFFVKNGEDSILETIKAALKKIDLFSLPMVYLVDDTE